MHNRIAVVAAAGRHTKLSVVLGQLLDRRPFNLQVAAGTLGRIMKPHTRAWRAAGRLSEGRARHRPTGYYPPLS